MFYKLAFNTTCFCFFYLNGNKKDSTKLHLFTSIYQIDFINLVIWSYYNVPKAPLERSKLIFVEIEGLDSIHKVLSRKNLMLLANQMKEIFIVIWYFLLSCVRSSCWWIVVRQNLTILSITSFFCVSCGYLNFCELTHPRATFSPRWFFFVFKQFLVMTISEIQLSWC
jgi:hypothetical protein